MNTPLPQLPETRQLTAQVLSVHAISAHSYEVELLLPSEAEFLAGQYLELLLSDAQAVPYSIASAPARLPQAQLHILDQGEDSLSRQVLNYLRDNEYVEIRVASGSCVLCPERLAPETELILIAAGSGFAQMKSIMEQVVAESLSNPVHLYWGVRSADQLYGEPLVKQWSLDHASFRFVPVVEADAGWTGRRGQVHRAVMDDFDRLDRTEVFVCGSPAMVYAVEDDLLPQGLRQGHIHSDVFSYAPRPSAASDG